MLARWISMNLFLSILRTRYISIIPFLMVIDRTDLLDLRSFNQSDTAQWHISEKCPSLYFFDRYECVDPAAGIMTPIAIIPHKEIMTFRYDDRTVSTMHDQSVQIRFFLQLSVTVQLAIPDFNRITGQSDQAFQIRFSAQVIRIMIEYENIAKLII